jgi:hypothetical protein
MGSIITLSILYVQYVQGITAFSGIEVSGASTKSNIRWIPQINNWIPQMDSPNQ